MTSILFSESQKRILGLARQFDFWIKLTGPDAYSALRSGDASLLPVYAHEWTHYFQLLTTSLGNLVAETERLLLFHKLGLILATSAATSGRLVPPIESMLGNRDDLQADPRIRTAIANIRSLAGRMQALCIPWGELVCDEAFDLELLRQRPFTLNSSEHCLTYTSSSGSMVRLPITATQLLEHAAKANELMLTGGVIHVEELVPAMFDYYGILLYLVQEGRLRLVSAGPGLVRIELAAGSNEDVRTLGALMCMYATCQISQMLYVWPGTKEPDEARSDEFSVEFVEARLRASARVFCCMVDGFDKVAAVLDKGSPDARVRLDEICRTLELPSYNVALRVQILRARGAIDRVRSRKGEEGGQGRDYSALREAVEAALGASGDLGRQEESVDFADVYETLFLERSLVGLELLAREPEASVNPLFHSEGLPAPFVVFETAQGARRTVLRLPGQSEPNVMDIPKSWMSYYLELSMLVDKVLFDANLACYRDGLNEEEARVSRASLGCLDFAECFRRRKTHRVDFCTKSIWSEGAAGQYRVWEAVGPFLADSR